MPKKLYPKEQYTALEKLVKHYLVKYYYEKDGQELLVEDFLPLCGAILVPFLNVDIDDENKEKSIKGIIESLKTHTKRLNLEEYTFESVIDILKEKWLKVLSTQEQKKLLSGISLVTNIEDNGVFGIKDVTNLLENTLKMSDGKLGQYGDKTIQKKNIAEKISEVEKDENSLNVENSINDDIDSKEGDLPVKEFKCKKTPLKNKDVGEELKELLIYDKLVEARGGDDEVKNFEYIWQWKISQGEYKEIKDTLEAEETKKIIKKAYKKNKKYLFLIVAYIAEHYKREWYSDDTDTLFNIGFDNNYSKKIAEVYFAKKENKIYKSGEHTKWLNSLRVEGGLPIKFINNNESSNNNIAKLIEGIYKKDDDKIKDLIGNLNNQVLKQSFEHRHSIYLYIENLLSGLDKVCAKDDLNNDLFEAFNEILEEGRQKAGKKFDIKYDVWKSATSFNINRSLVMKECNSYDEVEPYIFSKKRLKGFNPYVFELKYSIGDWSRKQHFVPHQNNNDDEITLYRVDNHQFEIKLPCLDTENSKVEISIKKENRWDDFTTIDFPKEGYKEFRKDGGCEWRDKSYSRGDSSCAAVLYKTDVWSVDEKYNPIEVKGLDGFAWVEYGESVILTRQNENKKKVLYNTIEKFFIEPKATSYHPITNLSYIKTENKKVDIIIGGNAEERQETKVFLLKEPVEFIAKNIENDNEIEKKDILVEYKTLNETNYKQYNKSANLSGYVKFRITIRNSRFIVESCILPESATITRHCEESNGNIQFSDFPIKKEGVYDGDYNGLDDDYKDVEINLNEDCILKFKVARPLSRSDLFKDGKFVEDAVAIPIRFADKYEVRKFDINGVKRINIKKDIDWKSVIGKLQEVKYPHKNEYKNSEYKKHRYNYSYKKYTTGEICEGELIFKAYTKEFKFDKNIGYYVDSGKDVSSDNLCFNLLLLDDDATLCDITIEEKKQNNTRYLVLNLPEERGFDGIILQSLKDKDGNQLHPQHYYRPIFVPKGQNNPPSDNDKKDKRYYNICELSKRSRMKLPAKTYKHFDVVCQCECYFGALYELLALIHTPSCLILKKEKTSICIAGYDWCKPSGLISKEKRLAKFYLGYVKYCKEKNKEPNYKELWRMADEFGFNWLIIPRSVWLESLSKEDEDTEKKSIINLFAYRPNGVYERLLDEYWNLKWESQKGRSSGAYGFMKYILAGIIQDIIPYNVPSVEELRKEIDRLKDCLLNR